METWNMRLAQALDQSEMSKSALAAKIGVSVPTVSAWVGAAGITPAKTIAADNLMKACRILGVTPEWVMFREKDARGTNSSEEPLDDYAMVRRLDVKASQGPGNLVFHASEKTRLAFRKDFLRAEGVKEKDALLVYGDGDSMSPTIPDGAILMVNRGAQEFVNNKIFLIWLGDEALVKRLRREIGGGILVVSDNPDKINYPDLLVTPDKEDFLKIEGRVFWMGSRL